MDLPLVEIPSWSEGNPLYPLPTDYASLTGEGKRLARVNACRQWLIPHRDVVKVGDARIASVRFLDSWYLRPDPEDNFDPMFYKNGVVESPPFHWLACQAGAVYPLSLCVWPRGSAKTTRFKVETILDLLSSPGYSTVYATNSGDNTKAFAGDVRRQYVSNRRVADDWHPHYGKLRPGRGEESWGLDQFVLRNLSSLRTFSINSSMRGNRPRKFAIDDPENDEKQSTNMEAIRAYMNRLITQLVIPMTSQPGCSVMWWATFVSKRHYAWQAMETVLDPKTGRMLARDPIFDEWHRLLVKAAYVDKDGELRSCWPEMWPLTDEDAERNWDGVIGNRRVSLESMRRRMGESAFRWEMMGEPGEGTFAYFGELSEELHGYWYERVDPGARPQESESLICWWRKGEIVKVRLSEFVTQSRFFQVCDTSYTSNTTSDYKGTIVFALTSHNELFVMDAWAGKTHQNVLEREIWRLVDWWKVHSLHPETVKQSYQLYTNLMSVAQTRMGELVGTKHIPKIEAYRPPPMISKTARISSIKLRFEHGLIKLPMRARKEGAWRLLFEQIDSFNPDAKDGGLAHDDMIDMVGMTTDIIKGRVRNLLKEPGTPKIDVKGAIARTETEIDGVPIGYVAGMQDFTVEDVWRYGKKHEAETPSESGTQA